jgi:hypothetical protein
MVRVPAVFVYGKGMLLGLLRRWLPLFAAGWIVLSTNAQVIVYRNATTYEDSVGDYLEEYGDQIDLIGTARVLTKIQFEYLGEFYAQGDETARLRIYANDGPFWKGNPDYATPGTILWESGTFGISNGFHVVQLVVPSIRAPDTITWTVQFFGLSMRTGIVTPDPTITSDTAGLLFYGNPDIGLNYNDFWQRLADGWGPVKITDILRNNFGASVTAISEALIGQTIPPPGALTITAQNGLLYVRWPASSTGYVLQSKPSGASADWTDEETPAIPFGTQFEVVVMAQTPQQIFRLREETKAAKLEIAPDGINLRLRWPAAAKGYTLQSSDAAGDWIDLNTPTTATGNYFETIIAKGPGPKLFRLVQ